MHQKKCGTTSDAWLGRFVWWQRQGGVVTGVRGTERQSKIRWVQHKMGERCSQGSQAPSTLATTTRFPGGEF